MRSIFVCGLMRLMEAVAVTGRYKLNLFITVALLALCQSVIAQTPPCPAAKTITYEKEFKVLGDSLEIPIDLKPFETLELIESHDLGNDGNYGTGVAVSFRNRSGVEIYSDIIQLFYTGTGKYPSKYEEPYPWRGVVGPEMLPFKIVLTSVIIIGYGGGTPRFPKGQFTVIRKPRQGYNLGGKNFSEALTISSLPTRLLGSVRPGESGQYFKVTLGANEGFFLKGILTGLGFYGSGFNIDIYDSNQQDLTPDGSWFFGGPYGAQAVTTPVITNPNPNTSDFYIRFFGSIWPLPEFDLTIHPKQGTCLSCVCPAIIPSYPHKGT